MIDMVAIGDGRVDTIRMSHMGISQASIAITSDLQPAGKRGTLQDQSHSRDILCFESGL